MTETETVSRVVWSEYSCHYPGCHQETGVAILPKSGKSEDMILCRSHALEFMAMISLETQKDIVLKGLEAVTK